MKKNASPGIATATAEYLAGLPLEGAERVLGSLAVLLAESLEESPLYARAALARQLADVLSSLSRADLERRRDEVAEAKIATKRAEHEAGVRRQKALLAELGVPDVSPAALP